ncbi:MAG: hypothetical protein HN742_11935 [Lentisphaerae bacterium]|nr:hypothetical protein [Lentisphaerota bacterium]MBT5610538.1 hypothetical protein [Lentisphaerota bacterium]MBT7054410.1 hypothetical protein [Lentisphaerota bacterium]MBT7842579.1 hypothetical protein [Lentisphaerota bacterium]
MNTPSDLSGGEIAPVTCPQCSEQQVVETTTVLRPGETAVQELFEGELNCVTCEACETRFFLDIPLLYRDDEVRWLIHFMPLEDATQWEKAEKQMESLSESIFDSGDAIDLPDCRLTLTRRTFIEKISLLQHRLDDRLVEYIKYQLYRAPDSEIDPIRNELLYDFSSKDSNRLAFIIFDRESGQAAAATHIDFDLYQELAAESAEDEGLGDALDELFPGYYVNVDRLL